ASTVTGWAIFYRIEEGSFRFWGDVMTRTAGSEAGMHPTTLLRVLTEMLPLHLGHAVVLMAPFGLWLALRRGQEQLPERRWLALCGLSVLAFFCLTVLLSQYSWDHNLFWKWMITPAPFILLAGSHSLVCLGRKGLSYLQPQEPRRSLWLLLGVLGAGLIGGSIVLEYSTLTRSQVARSNQWYGTQVRLMDWVEDNYPDDVILVADNIPATYLERIPNQRNVIRWSSERVPNLSREDFGAWLVQERVSLVFTFAENNEGSLTKAPWLAEIRPISLGPVQLQPIAREEGYGFIAWQVEGSPTAASPRTPPPVNAGAIRVVIDGVLPSPR
ncbi:MAG: hypothetical protein VX498_08860, partial [Myxococcota bacterium]|nr:hypothetical protein [Myxococcota bacterium]